MRDKPVVIWLFIVWLQLEISAPSWRVRGAVRQSTADIVNIANDVADADLFVIFRQRIFNTVTVKYLSDALRVADKLKWLKKRTLGFSHFTEN